MRHWTLLFPLLLGLCAAPIKAQTIAVSLISPRDAGNAFFGTFGAIAAEAASDLDIDFSMHHASDDPHAIVRLAREISQDPAPPDYVMLVGHKGTTLPAMRLLHGAGIRTLIVNGRLEEQAPDNPHWIGSLVPDEIQAGALLAERLCNGAHERGLADTEGRVQLLALRGNPRSPAAIDRYQGLKAHLVDDPTCELVDAPVANWSRELARTYSHRQLDRSPRPVAIWAAGDEMALGAVDAARRLRLLPGQDLLTAGVDWLPQTFDAVERGEVLGTAGGHIFDGAWAMVLIRDHADGRFSDRVHITTPFEFADRATLARLRPLLAARNWRRIDFGQFRRNEGESGWRFGIASLLDATLAIQPGD